jgi:PAS domain S-box-containing protein
MNQFFGMQDSQEDLQPQMRKNRNGAPRNMSTSVIPPPFSDSDGMTYMTGMVGGDTLDDIIMQNNKEIQRRRSLQRDRSSSVMEYGPSNSNLSGFQFTTASTPGDLNPRRQSTGELEMVGYQNMTSGMNIQGPQMGFPPSMQTEAVATHTSAYAGMPSRMAQGMMGYGSVYMEGMADNAATIDMFLPTSFSNPFGGSMASMPNNFMAQGSVREGLPSHGDSLQGNDGGDIMPRMPDLGIADNNLLPPTTDMDMGQTMAEYSSPISPLKPTMSISPVQESPYSIPTTVASTMVQQMGVMIKKEPETHYENVYCQSGFDMLRALFKVVSRKTPEINIGKVDLSCAFVVCDITLDDCPIVYVSDVFERMTGYTKFEILGRNCRFLQSPDGKVQGGTHREFVDNNSVYYLSKMIAEKREAQRSLINYRKGGQPFTNLLTMIPITGEDDKEIKYYVGFQVDLVEKPTSVEGKDNNGMYTVDYTQVGLPQYRWQQPPQKIISYGDGSQTMSRDDVSAVLSSINRNTGSEAIRGMWDKVLLENADDVVHVLSLKGLFLYLSPSCRQILEYDASELVGTLLSSVCHPSDIVPVTRELKDTSTGVPVSVVFRIRRKKSGYTWFESHGSLCVEHGKGRKCIILVGRERPVYTLSRRDIEAAGGINENEMWSKLSTSAMFLFVSSNVRTLLDLSPDDLLGTSLQALMRPESRVQFGRALEKARNGERITYKHEILNKRGLVMQAQTRLYPGDAADGQKPTFLIAQTRFLKTSPRPVAPSATFQVDQNPMTSTDPQSSEEGASLGHASAITGQDGRPTLRYKASISDQVTSDVGMQPSIGTQEFNPTSEDNIFDELNTTRCTSWQFELRQMEKSNRLLVEELAFLLSNRKKRKRRKGAGHLQRDCANCHTRVTPEWRRGPSGQRDLCNSCGLRWAKQVSKSSSDQNNGHRLAVRSQILSDPSTSQG